MKPCVFYKKKKECVKWKRPMNINSRHGYIFKKKIIDFNFVKILITIFRKPNRFKSQIKSFRVTLTSSYIAAFGESIRPQTKQTQSPKMSVLIFTCLDHVILLGLDFCVCSLWLELLALDFLQKESQISFFIILNLVH